MTEIKYSHDFYFPSLNNEQHYEETYNTSNSYKDIDRICHQSIDKHNHYADELYNKSDTDDVANTVLLSFMSSIRRNLTIAIDIDISLVR